MFSISRHSDFTPSGATCSALSNSFPPVTMAGRAHALSLYKSILRAHAKYMPLEMRQLGDAYVKAEVRSFVGAVRMSRGFCTQVLQTYQADFCIGCGLCNMIISFSWLSYSKAFYLALVPTPQIGNQNRSTRAILHWVGQISEACRTHREAETIKRFGACRLATVLFWFEQSWTTTPANQVWERHDKWCRVQWRTNESVGAVERRGS